jgi:hypothetical protein
VTFLAVTDCGDESHTKGYGLLWRGRASVSNINFTRAIASGFGAGLAGYAGSVKYGQLLGCAGASIAHGDEKVSDPPSYEFSNFLSNTILPLPGGLSLFGHGSAVFAYGAGFLVSDCAFADNTNNYDCHGIISQGVLLLVRCYFSGNVSTMGGGFMSDSLCVSFTRTHFPVSGIASAYCAAGPAPRPTPQFLPSDRVFVSNDHGNSDIPAAFRAFHLTRGRRAVPAIHGSGGPRRPRSPRG